MRNSKNESAPPLVVKSTYNFVWDNVRMEPIRLAMINVMVEQGFHDHLFTERLASRMVLAQRRSTNMFDVTNMLNRSILKVSDNDEDNNPVSIGNWDLDTESDFIE